MSHQLPPGFRLERKSNTEEFFINMGPQHPSTHGALRLTLRMDGETIVEVVPHFGYIHRGMEKQAESMSYLQYIAMSDRQDYLTAIQNNLGVVIALEKGMNVGVPLRGEYIRVMLQELGRIASHLVFYGCFGGDLGGQTCLLFGFKEREMIHDILEEVTGSRLTTNFFRPGGSRYDVPDTFIPRVKAFLDHMEDTMKDYERFLSKNIIVLERSIGIGVLSKEDAIAYGCSGPVLRASGVNFDVRRANPYSIYDQLDFDVPVFHNGDCYDRYHTTATKSALQKFINRSRFCASASKSSRPKVRGAARKSQCDSPWAATTAKLKPQRVFTQHTLSPQRPVKSRTASTHAVQASRILQQLTRWLKVTRFRTS